jgi:hypothetical protein
MKSMVLKSDSLRLFTQAAIGKLLAVAPGMLLTYAPIAP